MGSTVSEGIAALTIGVLLVVVGLQLARRNHDFLLGEPAPIRVQNDVRQYVLGTPGVIEISELLVSFVGNASWVLARVRIDATLNGGQS